MITSLLDKAREVDLDSVLESELGQKWRYDALKACISCHIPARYGAVRP